VLHDPAGGAVSRLHLEGDHLGPASERLPVECWKPIQSGSERAFDFMARYGIGGGSAAPSRGIDNTPLP